MAGEIIFQSVREFVVYIAQSPPGVYVFWSTIGAMTVIVYFAVSKTFQEERTPAVPADSPPPPPNRIEDQGEGYVPIQNENFIED